MDQTLLLNQGFEPIKVISWQRAITLLFLGKVEVIRRTSSTVITTATLVATPDKLGDADAVDKQIDAEAKPCVGVVGKHRL